MKSVQVWKEFCDFWKLRTILEINDFRIWMFIDLKTIFLFWRFWSIYLNIFEVAIVEDPNKTRYLAYLSFQKYS